MLVIQPPVGAGHARANGRLDDEHLFYLQARGIPLDEARRLVIRGFFGELIRKIGVPDLEERITASIERELGPSEPWSAQAGPATGREGGMSEPLVHRRAGGMR